MKIVVTGCNGNVGRHVVAFALRAGHTVFGIDYSVAQKKFEFLDNPKFSFQEADLCDYEQALRLLEGAEAVIHLAGVPQPKDYAVNTHNTYVLYFVHSKP